MDPSLSLAIGVSLMISINVGVVLLAYYSNILRDSINDYAAFFGRAQRIRKWRNFIQEGKKEEIHRSYSLSRSQLAFWTLIITNSYLYLYFIKYPSVPISWDLATLAMLGVSVGTTAGGMLIDNSQDEQARHQNSPAQNFFIDILSDDNGVSIGRFQQLVWNIIAAIIYISQIGLEKGHLPKLDTAILALCGFGNAAYLALKAGENNTNKVNTTISNNLQEYAPGVNLPNAAYQLKVGNQSQPH